MRIQTSPTRNLTAPARGRRTVLRAVLVNLSATALAAAVMVTNGGAAAATGSTEAGPLQPVTARAPISGPGLFQHPIHRMCWICIG